MISEECNNDTLSQATGNLQLSSLPCDQWHHYYHYQASAQYVWLAETLCALGKWEEAKEAYTKAVFQDHQNQEAIEGQKGRRLLAKAPLYDKHPISDIAFCSSVGQLPAEATHIHDEAATFLQSGDVSMALVLFNKAISTEPMHSNSFFGRAKCWFALQKYEKARADFAEAVRLSHLHHDAYHRMASGEHVQRGQAFLAAGQIDLAIADFTKALDLYRGNKEALMAKEEAYKRKMPQ